MTPPPGSPEAIEQGCTCPVFDNCKGRGCGLTDKDGNPLYYINEKCQLHGAKEGEKEFPAHSDELDSDADDLLDGLMGGDDGGD